MAENNADRRFPEMASASSSLNDRLGEDVTMLPVVSDILRPSQTTSLQTSSSSSFHSNQSPLAKEQIIQRPSTAISASSSRPKSQLAVHIRSSAQSSPSHVRQGQPMGNGPKLQPKRDPIVAKGSISVVLPSVPIQHRAAGANILPKKRGRPKGWKLGGSYADRREGDTGDPKLSVPKKDPSKEQKRRGRPPRDPTPSAREWYLQSNVEYVPFLCEWKPALGHSCPAELQNMKTLRRHVFLIHGDEDPLVCRWGKCAARDHPIQFTTQAEFEEHMEGAHFRSFVWYMGDGYQNDGIETLKRDDDEVQKYLFDKDGNQVTPSVTDQTLEDDQQYKERKRKLRRLLIQQDENAPTEEEYTKQTLGLV
ncbi:hypothetical protein F5Y11DRAFT_315225 [Daldinia sp. FL1419]|nr:hypothetical protein F5Y11DRAFT_315225 [Daldinia sp. FL1419]